MSKQDHARPGAVQLADRVRRAVDGGVDRAEEIHKRVANFPLEVMEQLEILEKTVKDVQEAQDRSIHAAYDVVRVINRDVIRFAKRTLRARARPAKKKAKKAGSVAAHEAA